MNKGPKLVEVARRDTTTSSGSIAVQGASVNLFRIETPEFHTDRENSIKTGRLGRRSSPPTPPGLTAQEPQAAIFNRAANCKARGQPEQIQQNQNSAVRRLGRGLRE
jgi:hypothetical protein